MRRYQQAFTLIELMVTVVVLAIVFAIALPSFNQQIINANSVALAEDLAGAFSYARTEAVKRGTRVSICASDNGTSCSGGWADGYIAYVDTAVADTTAETTVGLVLKYWTDFDPRAKFSVTRDDNDSKVVTFIRYTGFGSLARDRAGGVTLDSQLEGCVGEAARRLTIGLSGLVTIKRIACTSGV